LCSVRKIRTAKRETGESPVRFRRCKRVAVFVSTGKPGKEKSV
jgi:hypothetical protein